jgi:hypothetical protein
MEHHLHVDACSKTLDRSAYGLPYKMSPSASGVPNKRGLASDVEIARRREGAKEMMFGERKTEAVAGVHVWRRERESVDKRDERPACISFFITIAPI